MLRARYFSIHVVQYFFLYYQNLRKNSNHKPKCILNLIRIYIFISFLYVRFKLPLVLISNAFYKICIIMIFVALKFAYICIKIINLNWHDQNGYSTFLLLTNHFYFNKVYKSVPISRYMFKSFKLLCFLINK